MEEAENLNNCIAIMKRGELVACGSSLELKNEYGSGYKYFIYFSLSICNTPGS